MKPIAAILLLICVLSGISALSFSYFFAIPYLLSFAGLCYIFDKTNAEKEPEEAQENTRKDLTDINHCDIFYGHILPEMYAEMMNAEDFETLKDLIESRYLINAHQWSEIKDEFYEIKEGIKN